MSSFSILGSAVRKELNVPQNIQLCTWRDRLIDVVFGCRQHRWAFPITIKGMKYMSPYTAHQTCTACGVHRYYDATEMLAGPMYRITSGPVLEEYGW